MYHKIERENTDRTDVESILENESKMYIVVKRFRNSWGGKYHINFDLLIHWKPVFHFCTPENRKSQISDIFVEYGNGTLALNGLAIEFCFFKEKY